MLYSAGFFKAGFAAAQLLPRSASHWIGATIALHGDGEFVQTVYFTSEAEARQRESMPPPPEMAEAMQDAAIELGLPPDAGR